MSAAMGLVPLVCLFVAAWSGITAADGPTVVPLVVKENEEVVLECSLGENAQGKIFSWTKDGDEVITINLPPTPPHIEPLFQGRVSHFPEALQSGDASIRISRAKVSDGGRYICEFPNENPKTRASISLIVGASPRLIITTLRQPNNLVLLRCEVLGAFPKPHVVWQDSAGTVLQAEEPQITSRDDGKYDTVLNIAVTKDDNFRCIATQKEFGDPIYAETAAHPIIPWYGWLGIIAAIIYTVAVGCIVGVLCFREHSKKSKSKKGGSNKQQDSVALPLLNKTGHVHVYQCSAPPTHNDLEAHKRCIPDTAIICEVYCLAHYASVQKQNSEQSRSPVLIVGAEGGCLHCREQDKQRPDPDAPLSP